MDTTTETTPLRAVAPVCTLSPSPKRSSSQLLAERTMATPADHGVAGTVIRIADHDVKPGVEVDMGGGDAWTQIRDTILGCDILVLSTPIRLGHPTSIARRVLERLDAELGFPLAVNTAHLARRLKASACPPSS
ncbi:flavodoxin family protein [Streptomyces sp. NPDC056367]|uniref:flavodoxin family protein n=1 Tax=Streptomyces sp. NPDC056367 TaxID=3345797 RepID=UPI0035E183EE